LIAFAKLIEDVSGRHEEFRTQVVNCDADIFIYIPELVVLHSSDSDILAIIERFYPDAFKEDSDSNRKLVELK